MLRSALHVLRFPAVFGQQTSVSASMGPALVSRTSEVRTLSELLLTVESGNFAPQLHIQIVRPPSAFRGDPVYVFGRVLDIAGFAMDTVLRIDDKTWV